MTQHAECGVWVRDRLRRALPRGTPLPDADWSRRHVVIGVVALAHVPVVFAFAVIAGFRLHLVRRMVVAHGGRVTVDCEDGTTTFVVRLPAAAPDPSEATESVAARTDSLLGSG